MNSKNNLNNKKSVEFKKIAFSVIVVACMGFLVWSYILATIGAYQVNEGISEALIHTVLGSYAAYVFASYSEKNSRNKYSIKLNDEPVYKEGEKGDD